MSQWAEIRQMHVVDGVPKKQIAERLGLDIKTVRRAVAQATAPARRAVSRPRHLDRWRAQIEQWLRQDRRLTAKRIRRLLLPLAGPVAERTVRWYVARLKAAAAPKEGVGARMRAGLRASNRRARHLPMRYETGLPSSVIRFRTLHASTASRRCPDELRARRQSPTIDVYRKNAFSTRAC